jgi:hypothetical protein
VSLLDTFLEEGLNDPPYVAGNAPRREVFISIRVDGVAGAGTPDDPFNGSTDTLLDDLLNSLTIPNLTLRFGPGIFQTKGALRRSVNPPGGWLLQSGTRIVGSGMNQTTLQLVKLTPSLPLTLVWRAFLAVHKAP